MRYITLLRGINVGGKNIVRMPELKACFEKTGFSAVVTYIQSGNVIFDADIEDRKLLINTIEDALNKSFGLNLKIVLISKPELQEVFDHAPPSFSEENSGLKRDVIFLRDGNDPAEIIKIIPVKEGIDQVDAGKQVLYFSRLAENSAQSRMSRIIQLPVYKEMTIRNWNTVTRLLAL